MDFRSQGTSEKNILELEKTKLYLNTLFEKSCNEQLLRSIAIIQMLICLGFLLSNRENVGTLVLKG